MRRTVVCGIALSAAFAVTARSQEQGGDSSQKKVIEKTQIKPTSPASGGEMYLSYCAVCHGKDGKGNGPAAPALKAPAPDLTLLAKNNNGKFPADRVSHVLRFGIETPAHGTKDMPIWGPLLGSLQGQTGSNEGLIQLRIANLTKYIESLQSK